MLNGKMLLLIYTAAVIHTLRITHFENTQTFIPEKNKGVAQKLS